MFDEEVIALVFALARDSNSNYIYPRLYTTGANFCIKLRPVLLILFLAYE